MAFLDTESLYGHRSTWSARRSGPSRHFARAFCSSNALASYLSQASLPASYLDPSVDVSVNPTSSEWDGVPLTGDLIGGKFRITETLGHGGMGVVLGGEHLDLRQAVAIKLLRPALAKEPDAQARFLREARAAASIRSRYAVRIYDVGTTELGVPYIVMERLHGIGIDALLEKHGSLAIEQAVTIVVEAAEAIAEANGIGIVHRDVKPSNLFLANDASGIPIVKVLDFGISKRITLDDGQESASLTAPQTLLGSPQYMSPEQLRDPRTVDERTDVWGLGVTLYELLTGRMPFESDSIPELCALIFNSTPARADSVRPEIPAELSDVIDACLVKRTEGRIPSVAALVARLAPFGRGELATTAEKLARAARPAQATPGSLEMSDEGRAPRAPVAARRSRRRLAAFGATAASAAVGLALLARGRSGSTPMRNEPAQPVSSTAASATIIKASEPAAIAARSPATTSVDDASIPGSASASASASAPAPTLPSPNNPGPGSPGAHRPRGLKGIKLID